MEIFKGAKIQIASDDEQSMAKFLGNDVSFSDEDRHVTAKLFNGHIYILKIESAGPRE